MRASAFSNRSRQDKAFMICSLNLFSQDAFPAAKKGQGKDQLDCALYSKPVIIDGKIRGKPRAKHCNKSCDEDRYGKRQAEYCFHRFWRSRTSDRRRT